MAVARAAAAVLHLSEDLLYLFVSVLLVAGSLSFADCQPVVRLRACALQEAVPEGKGARAAVLGGGARDD